MNSPSDSQSISFGFTEDSSIGVRRKLGVFPDQQINPTLIPNLGVHQFDVNSCIRQLESSIKELSKLVDQLMISTAPYRKVDEVNTSLVDKGVQESGTSQLSDYLLARIREIRDVIKNVQLMNRTVDTFKINDET